MAEGLTGGAHDPAFDELREAYARRELVLFVGAGLSTAAGLPSKERLVELLTERAKARGVAEGMLAEITELADRHRLPDALSALKSALGAPDFGAAVERALDDGAKDVPDLGLAVAALAPGLRALLTTNLDHLLERALDRRWRPMVRPTGDLAQRERVIVKLHGTLIEHATWVLTREDFDRAGYTDQSFAPAFSAMFHARTLLFAGYGLANDDFDQVLGRARALSGGQAPRHFALVPVETMKPYERDKLERSGLRLILYANPDGTHAELARILRVLAGVEEGPSKPAPGAVVGAVMEVGAGAGGRRTSGAAAASHVEASAGVSGSGSTTGGGERVGVISFGTTVSGAEMEELQNALLSAFPSRLALAQLVRFGLDRNLDELAGSGNLRETAFELLKETESKNSLVRLVEAALKRAPDNAKLVAFANKHRA